MLYAFAIKNVIGEIRGGVIAGNKKQARDRINDWYQPIFEDAGRDLRSAIVDSTLRPAYDCCPDIVVNFWHHEDFEYEWNQRPEEIDQEFVEWLPERKLPHIAQETDKLFMFSAYGEYDLCCSGAIVAENVEQARLKVKDVLGNVVVQLDPAQIAYPDVVLSVTV